MYWFFADKSRARGLSPWRDLAPWHAQERGDISVYQDEDSKPLVGQELNKPATLVLERILPPAGQWRSTAAPRPTCAIVSPWRELTVRLREGLQAP